MDLLKVKTLSAHKAQLKRPDFKGEAQQGFPERGNPTLGKILVAGRSV
jgi:hypothetical protein